MLNPDRDISSLTQLLYFSGIPFWLIVPLLLIFRVLDLANQRWLRPD